MGWIITAVILVFLVILPLGAGLSYDAAGATVRIIAGPIRITLFPRKKKTKKEEKKSSPKKDDSLEKTGKNADKSKAEASNENESEKKSKSGGSWKDFLPLVQVLLDTLNRFRRKLRVNRLEMKVILAGDDPCDLGLNYGRAWAAVSNLLSAFDSVFVIQKQDVQIECDFTADKTLVTARVDLTITLGRLLAIASIAAVKGLREYFKIMKKRKAVS